VSIRDSRGPIRDTLEFRHLIIDIGCSGIVRLAITRDIRHVLRGLRIFVMVIFLLINGHTVLRERNPQIGLKIDEETLKASRRGHSEDVVVPTPIDGCRLGWGCCGPIGIDRTRNNRRTSYSETQIESTSHF